MKLSKQKGTSLENSLDLEPAQPLWKRAPKRDENGDSLFDFIMHIPKLNQQPKEKLQEKVQQIETILSHYGKKSSLRISI